MPPKPVRNYSVGDLVFAKIKGYPPWPARIEKDLPNGYKPYPNRYPVFFFGTNELAVVSAKEIYPYEQYKHQLGIRRKKMKNFNEGLDEIEKHPNLSIDSEKLSEGYRQKMNVDRHPNRPDEFTDSDVSYSDPKSEESESSSDMSESDSKRETKITSTTKTKRNPSKPTIHRKKSRRSRNESSPEKEKNGYRKKHNLKKTLQTEKSAAKRVSRRAIYVPDDDDCISSSESDDHPPPKLVTKIVVNDSNDSEVAFSDGNTSYGHESPKKSTNQDRRNSEGNSPDSQDDDLLTAALYESRKRAKANQEKKSEEEEEARKKPKLAHSDGDTKVKSNSNASNNEQNKVKNDVKKSIHPEENIEDVLKLKQKLSDEKLAQKLKEKEREKERRKREKMERKRLERLKQQQSQKSGPKPSQPCQQPEEDQIKTINKILVEIDQSIKNSLSKNNANIDKCLEAMNNIDEVKGKITSKSLSNYSDNLKELIQTLKKCRKYKQEERVRQKADLYFNKLKEFFIHPNDSQAAVSSAFTSTYDATKTDDNGEEEKTTENNKEKKSVDGNNENQVNEMKQMKSTDSEPMEENLSKEDDNQPVVSSTTASTPMDLNNSDSIDSPCFEQLSSVPLQE